MPTADLLWAAPIHDPIPPQPYSHWVWAVALGLLLAIGSWYWWLWRHTRPRPAPDLPTSYWASVRENTLQKVDLAEEQYRSGQVDLRSLHLELNTTLREYATERLGQDAMWMTAAEIGRFSGAGEVSRLLASYEEPAFSFDSDAEAIAATAAAREVIRTW